MLLLGLHLIGLFKFTHGIILPKLGSCAIEFQEHCPAPMATVTSLSKGLLRTMPKKAKKSKASRQHKDDSVHRSNTGETSTIKRKRLGRRCKAVLNVEEEQQPQINFKTTKKKLVEEPNISSASGDELCILYDLQEEKKNKVYEVITVASDDESGTECKIEPSNDKKITTEKNTEETDDEIIFLGTVNNTFNTNSLIDGFKYDPLGITDSSFRLPVSLTDYRFPDSTLNSKMGYIDSVSKASDKLMNRIRACSDKKIEEVTLSSDSDSCDSLTKLNLNTFDLPGNDKSFSRNFNQGSEAVNSFLNDSKHDSGSSTNVGLKLRVRKTKDMHYSIVEQEDSLASIPNLYVSPSLSGSSSNEIGESSDDSSRSSSSRTLFGSGSSADESTDESCDGTSMVLARWKEAEDSRNKQLFRYEEFTDLGKKFNNGELKEDSNNMIIKFMSFNMLSQTLLDNHRELYRMHDLKALRWEFRWQLLFEEIITTKPDILCMQEVETNHLDSYYKQLLDFGYNYIYKKRTRSQVDGCAIYYNQDKFILDEYVPLEYYNRNIYCLDRDNVALVARFKVKESPEDAIVVATTHLLYNPRRFDVRLAQTQLLLAEIDRLAYNSKTNTYYPIILTGDLNEQPSFSVYRLISEGKFKYAGLSYKTLQYTHDYTRMPRVLIPPWKGITDNCQHVEVLKDRQERNMGQQVGEEDHLQDRENANNRLTPGSENSNMKSFASGKLTHNLKLTSVYNNTKEDGTIEGTTHHDSWITVDYIFYSLVENKETKEKEEGNLKLLSKLRLPSENELKNKIKCIPNYACGSDHLPLVATFLLRLKDPKHQ